MTDSEKPVYSKEDLARFRARQIMHRVTQKSISYGGDKRVVRVAFPGEWIDDPRTRLVEALTAGMDDDLANNIVDALDAYLEEGPDRSIRWVGSLPPNYKSELERARAERDAAITCAEQALEQMQATLDTLRTGIETETEPEKTNGHAASS